MTVSIVKGVTPDGRVVTLRLNEDGSLVAANQDEQTALLEELRSSITTLSSYVDGLEGYSDVIEANQRIEIARLIEIRDRLNVTGLLSDADLISEAPLTAVGSTPARSMAGYSKLTYQIDVNGVGNNVVVRAEGNLVGSSFINLSANNQDITITSNGFYLITFEGKITNTRFTLVSFSGGTPSVTAHLLRGN